MKLLKAFMAGVALPVIVCPFILLTLIKTGNINILENTPLYFVPLLWGIWNMLLVGIGDKCPIKNLNYRELVHGGTLGFILALLGLFVFNVDMALFGTAQPAYWVLIAAPIVYAIVWRYVVHPLNKMVGL